MGFGTDHRHEFEAAADGAQPDLRTAGQGVWGQQGHPVRHGEGGEQPHHQHHHQGVQRAERPLFPPYGGGGAGVHLGAAAGDGRIGK